MIETSAGPRRLGVMYLRDQPPEQLIEFARAAEACGADDLWVVEDLTWAGGVSSAASALAVTSSLRVGIGITPAPLRNPALLAMELATLARMHPGRLVAGIGHGVPEWMDQVGAGTRQRLALLEETIAAVRGLLNGERVTIDGSTVHIDGVQLVHPPHVVPPIIAGVIGPRSLELAGRIADGTLVVEGRGPREIAAIHALVEKGRASGDLAADRPHELYNFAMLCLDEDPERLRTTLSPMLDAYSQMLGVPRDEVFAAAGGPADVAARVHELWDAGIGTVILRPVGDDPLGQLAGTVEALRKS
ncbi:MAG: LLM class flavin-dependent oxidoreductase [Actinocrinis sp.]